MLAPILRIGQYSYEIYLTHMFVVFALFALFLKAGKHMSLAPVLFVATVIVSGMLGAVVANFYSEPMNRLLRRRFLAVSTISGESVHAQSATATE